jgi:hemerythrin-like domain-containing protein
MNDAIRILKDEHRSISAVMHGLKHLARMAHEAKVRPQFQVFRSMLRYLDEYPERLHHPKEDQYLFACLEMRFSGAKSLLETLRAEHVSGESLIRELERKLLFLEESWPEGTREFLDAVDAYADFHWRHMTREEHELLPLAEKHLSAEDWKAIGEQFAHNKDPIAGMQEHDYEKLFSRIATLAPAPIGLGDPWRKSAA